MQRLDKVMTDSDFIHSMEAFTAKMGWSLEEPPKPAVCEHCGGRGLYGFDVPVGHELFGKLFPCEYCEIGRDLLIKRWTNGLKSAGLPLMYQRMTFETWAQLGVDERKGKRLAESMARLFVANDNGWVSMKAAFNAAGREFKGEDEVKNWIIFHGPMGLGKTGLTAAIVNYRAVNKLPTLYIRLQSFLQDVIDRYSENFEPRNANEPKTAGEVINLAKDAPVLVMDEINLQAASDHSQRVFEDIIRYRAGHEKPTLATCNFTQDELKTQWNPWAVDMLLSKSHWIPMSGMRLREKAEATVKEAF